MPPPNTPIHNNSNHIAVSWRARPHACMLPRLSCITMVTYQVVFIALSHIHRSVVVSQHQFILSSYERRWNMCVHVQEFLISFVWSVLTEDGMAAATTAASLSQRIYLFPFFSFLQRAFIAFSCDSFSADGVLLLSVLRFTQLRYHHYYIVCLQHHHRSHCRRVTSSHRLRTKHTYFANCT